MSYLSPLFTKRILLWTAGIALFYLIAQASIFNSRLLIDTLTHNFSLAYKATIVTRLITGYFQMFDVWHVLLIALTALLVGANLSLLVSSGKKLRESGKTKLSLGGSGLLSVVSVGCTSCSISLFAVLGSGGGIAGLILSSWWMQVIILSLLVGSIIYSLRSYKSVACEI